MLCWLQIKLSNWINFHTLLRKIIYSRGQHSTVRGKRFEWRLRWWNVCPVRLYVWRALLHPSQISTVDSQLDIFTPKQFSTSESLVLTIRKLSFCDFFPQTMQSVLDLLPPSTLQKQQHKTSRKEDRYVLSCTCRIMAAKRRAGAWQRI